MPLHTPLAPASEWVQLSTTDADWAQADAALLGSLLAHMHIIRGFEECVLELAGEGLVHGPAHSSIGQEGGAAGSIVSLTTADQINGSHRGHHQFLSKALGHIAPQGLDPKAPLEGAVQQLLQRTFGIVTAGKTGHLQQGRLRAVSDPAGSRHRRRQRGADQQERPRV